MTEFLVLIQTNLEFPFGLWGGRQKINFVCGDKQKQLLQFRKGESDLFYRNGIFFLNIVCEIAENKIIDVQDFIGIDLGIAKILADSDGKHYSGKPVEQQRSRFLHRRKNLQKKQSRSAKRKLCQLKRRHHNYQTNENHRISKELIALAKDTGRGIGLEDLKNVRQQITAQAKTKKHRAKISNWSFRQLRCFIEYKAKREGIPVKAVDPGYTSQICSQCGHKDKKNRRKECFKCRNCGFTADADTNAALNIRARAASQSAERAADAQGSDLSYQISYKSFD